MAEHQLRTVILADRSPTQRDLCRGILQGIGWRVVAANDPSEVATLIRVYRPELVIMGLSRPAEVDIEAIQQLRRDPSTAGVSVLIVGHAPARKDMTAALEAGGDEYLAWPFRRKEFLLRIELALSVRRSQRRVRQSQAALSRRVRAMTTLQDFYEQMLGHAGIEATCRRSAQAASELMDSQRVSILLTEPDGCSLRFVHAIGMDDVGWRDRRVPLSSPVVGRVMATRREMIVNHCTLWPAQDRYRSRPFVSLPLLQDDSEQAGPPLGVLNVTERRDGRDYEPHDVLALRQLARATAFSINTARTRRKLDATRDSILFSLARLSEYRHASTGRHLERVRELSLVLATDLAGDTDLDESIDVQFLSDLGRAAPLHDVGKVGIPDRILLKPGRLTPEEYALIQNHTRIGAAALQSVIATGHDATFLKMAMDIAHCHHERYDGTGYPRRLAGRQIPLCARIVCLADTYDAIRTPREYKPARTHAEAIKELSEGSGTQFDPLVVAAFCRLQDQFDCIYNGLTEDLACLQGPSDGLLPELTMLPIMAPVPGEAAV
jgi:response regulator RpfG family c-di-GMP phosphodiesterase